MVALAALLVLGKTQLVTLTVRARPLKETCDLIGKQAGLQLEVKGRMQLEPIILAVHDIDGDDLMAKIAEVVNASWTKLGDNHYELARTNAQEKKEYQDHIKLRIANNARVLAAAAKSGSLDKELTSQDYVSLLKARLNAFAASQSRPSDPEAWERKRNSGAALPARRALVRLLKDLNQTDLAGVAPSSSRVFSSEPTKMQFALGPHAESIVTDLVKERNLMLAAAERVPGGLVGMSGFSDNQEHAQIPWQEGGTVALKITYSQLGDALVATLRVYNSKGNWVLADTMGLESFPKLDAPPPLKDVTVTLSPESQKVMSAIRIGATYQREAKAVPPDKETTELLTNCTRRDPLSFCVSDVFLAAAAANNVNLIAVPDDDITMALLQFSTEPKANAFLQRMSWRSKSSLDPKWLTIAPVDRYAARLQRASRDAMKAYLSARAAQGYSTLDDKLKFVLDAPYVRQPSLHFYHELALGPTIRTFDGSQKAMRFYAALSPDQRKLLLEGGRLTVANLAAPALDLLEDWVFRSDYEGLAAVMKDGTSMVYGGKSMEPTFGVGEGLQRSFEITATAARNPVAVCFQDHGTYAMTADNLALNMARHYYLEEGEQEYPEPQSFRLGTNLEINLMVTFEPGLRMAGRINGLEVDMSGEPFGMEGLPARYREEYDRQLAKYIAALKKAGAKSTGVAEPPPP